MLAGEIDKVPDYVGLLSEIADDLRAGRDEMESESQRRARDFHDEENMSRRKPPKLDCRACAPC